MRDLEKLVLRIDANHETWEKALFSASQHKEIIFTQNQGPLNEAQSSSINRFFENSQKKVTRLLDPAECLELKIPSMNEKHAHLESFFSLLQRNVDVQNKIEFLISILDEIILNAFVSAPAAALEIGLQKSSTLPQFFIEWNNSVAWIHGKDSHGAFLRKNFELSFRPSNSPEITTHGGAGRGLSLILEMANELYIHSSTASGTWVAAKIDLKKTPRTGEHSLKTVVLDFK